MAKVTYYGAHGVTFEVDGVQKHTWTDWSLVPVTAAIPVPALPQPKTNFKDVPGSDGQLDYTEALAGLKYQMRQGSWEFHIVWNGKPWNERISEMLRFIQGRKCRIILDDDPNYYYKGRVAFEEYKGSENFSTVVIDYLLDPYRYPLFGTANYDWPWDNLVIDGSNTDDYDGDNTKEFGTIIYGMFDVEVKKPRTLVNSTSEDLKVSITVSVDMELDYNGTRYYLKSGPNSEVLTIPPGDTVVEFIGNGRVIIDYGMGKIL